MRSLGLALLLAVSLANGWSQDAPAVRPEPAAAAYRYLRVGAPQNIRVESRNGYALMGGGTDLDEAFGWVCDHAGGGDFLVLRAAGTDAYNAWLQKLCHLNSVATLIIPSREAAGNAFVAQTIASASAIFIAGGDQARYINFWAGTPVETALRAAVQRGIPIGGTSAGLAVLGQYIYSAQNDAADGPDLASEVALADPYAKQVVLAPDLLGIPLLRGVITDSHFDTRHREGRLLVFMARILASGQATTIRSIGVDEQTAVLVDADGQAHVVGKKDGSADFYEASRKPEQCVPGKSLSFKAVRTRIPTGESFDMKNWRGPRSFGPVLVDDGQVIHALY
jgi:cyanophycinase